MLNYEFAKNLYEELKEKAAENTDELLDDLYQQLLKTAREYADTRLSRAFMTQMERREADASRTIRHDGFMRVLEAVCRNFGITGIDDQMPNRKLKGDFACYMALFLALEQR